MKLRFLKGRNVLPQKAFGFSGTPLLKRAGVFVLAAAMIAVMQLGPAAVASGDADKPKSETVYAVLGNDGSYTGATVVNCFKKGGKIADYGQYDSIKNLTGPDEPVVEGDKVTWPASATQDVTAFYYEGETKKPLPISVGITYYLNGELQEAEDIAGRSGELRIEFTLRNGTGTGVMDEAADREVLVPFAASVSLTLDNTKFTVLDVPENGSSVLAGSSYTLSYASFPLPEDTFSFTVFGKDIALDPINIVMLPKSPPGLDSYGDFVDLGGLSQGADDMISGADHMQGGVGDLLGALRGLKDGVKKLQSGLGALGDGAGKLSGGTGSLYSNVKQMKASADAFCAGLTDFSAGLATLSDGMGTLNTNVQGMAAQLASLKDSAALLDAKVGEMGGGLGGIKVSNKQMLDAANNLALLYPDAAALAAGLSSQQSAIDAMASGGADLKTLSKGVSDGALDFYTAFSTMFSASVQQLAESSAQLYASSLELLGGSNALAQGCGELLSAAGRLDGGADDLADGTADIARKLPAMTDGINGMISGVEDLKDGIAELNDDGLKELKGKFDGLEGYLDKLSRQAAGYGSFMDERNAAASTVQFVLKTEKIGTQE
jgi:hypothetical protein